MTNSLETIACPLCGSRDTAVVFVSRDDPLFRNVICLRCSLVYLNPRMSAEGYRHAYKVGFTQAFMKLNVPADEDAEAAAAERKAMNIMRYLGPWLPKEGTVFEVGTGYGALLARAAQRGLRVSGIEPDPRAAERARVRGMDVRTAFLEDILPAWNAPPVDVILMHHVLEHTLDPVATLRQLKAIAKPTAILYLGVPNVLQPPFPSAQFFRPAHTINFSPYTLRRALDEAGWKTIDCDPEKSPIECIAMRTDSSRQGRTAAALPDSMRDVHFVRRAIRWSDAKRRSFRWARGVLAASPCRPLLRAGLHALGFRATSAGLRKISKL